MRVVHDCIIVYIIINIYRECISASCTRDEDFPGNTFLLSIAIYILSMIMHVTMQSALT